MNYMCIQQNRVIIYNTQKLSKILQFQFEPFTIRQIDNTSMKTPDLTFCALLGVKILEGVPFLIVVLEAQSICNIGTSVIYEIKKIEWIPLARKEKMQAIFDKFLETIKDMAKLYEDGKHYFSDNYKLYTTYYLNTFNEQNADQRKFYSQFVNNEGLMLIDEKTSIGAWCKPIIQGYVQQFVSYITPSQKMCFTIISRRSSRKQGTRYFSRGIDDTGNVANFTETQQIFSFGKFIISHIQIRGSVPAFFQQLGVVGISGQLNISRNQVMTQKAFKSHFAKLNSVYGRIFCVNLLSIKKSQEQKLTVFYQKLINAYSPPYVKYQYFDFHEQCKNNQFQNSKRLIDKIQQVINCFGVTLIDSNLKKVLAKQQGVFRTNCLDCLDRTNYIQSRIALNQLQRVIHRLSSTQTREYIARQEIFLNKLQYSSLLLKHFNKAWGDNGDIISIHYTGVGSTHTDITKTGERTFIGTINHKVRSAFRFFGQFNDVKKNQAIQTIHDNPLLRSKSISVNDMQGQFINVVIMSFDLNQPKDQLDYTEFIQNYVELKRPAGVVLFAYRKKKHRVLTWLKGKLQDSEIDSFEKEKSAIVRRLGYEAMKKIVSEDSCMVILGTQFAFKNITDLKIDNVYNKDDTMLICKFNIFGSSMVFAGVNCQTFEGFVKLIQKSHDEAFQSNKLGQARSSSILTHSYRTIVGNTASGNKLVKAHIQDIKTQVQVLKKQRDRKGQAKLVSYVLDGDELANSFNENYQYLKNYMQGPPSFILQGNRILFWNKQQLITKVLDYNANTETQCTYGHLSYQL